MLRAKQTTLAIAIMVVSGMAMAETDVNASYSSLCLNGECAYFNGEGALQFIKDKSFDGGIVFNKGGYATIKDGKFGLMNRQGQWAVEPSYSSIGKYGENGLALATKGGEYYFISHSGTPVGRMDYDEVHVFSENGLARVRKGSKWGYINRNGQEVIAPRYEKALDFSNNGLAAVYEKIEVIPGETSIGIFRVKINGGSGTNYGHKWYFIDKNGAMVASKSKIMNIIKDKYFTDVNYTPYGLMAAKIEGKGWEYFGNEGNVVTSHKFDDAKGFSKYGYARVQKGGKWGYIDENGKIVIAPQFDTVYDFNVTGLALVKRNGKIGYIDKQGNVVIPLQYSNGYYGIDFNHPLLSVEKDGKWGYVNRQNETVIPFQYEEAKPFLENGLAAVKQNGKWGYINQKGQAIIPIQMDNYAYFDPNGLISVKLNGNTALYNQQGKKVVYYDNICNGEVKVLKNNTEQRILPKEKTDIQICDEHAKAKAERERQEQLERERQARLAEERARAREEQARREREREEQERLAPAKTLINVEADCTSELLASCFVENFSIQPPSNSYVDAKSSSTGRYVTLTHYKGIPEGRYSYSLELRGNNRRKMCTGSFYTKGKKASIKINVYQRDCKISSVYEY